MFEEESFDLIYMHHPMFVGMTALYLGRKYQLPVIYTYHTRYEDYLHYIGFLKPEGKGNDLEAAAFEIGAECSGSGIYEMVYEPMRSGAGADGGDAETVAKTERECRWQFSRQDWKRHFIRNIQKKPEKSAGNIWRTTERIRKNRRVHVLHGGTSGREEKNPHFLLNGIRKLKRKNGRNIFQASSIGNGSMTEELKAEAKKLGIEEEIVFVGKVPNEKLNC